MKKKYLITGVAGFIGSHLSEKLLQLGHEVVGIDNFDEYYEIGIKKANLSQSLLSESFKFHEVDILDAKSLNEINVNFDCIIHLAGKAGVRPSIANSLDYVNVNVIGTQNILEFAKNNSVTKVVFASSSSVYGTNPNFPWSENDIDLKPISPYASTKMSGELMGHVFAHLYDISFIGLRFFTVYGPRQRPDLAINKFIKAINSGEEIPFYGNGNTQRDYTYIDDIVDGIIKSINYESKFDIINLGNSSPVTLNELILNIERVTLKKAKLNILPMQPGDVPVTFANIDKAVVKLGYNPQTSLFDGLKKYINWLNED